MSRQRLTIGTFGEIGHLASPSGRVVARVRYRDWDGKTRLVQATGNTRKSAERALKAKLADRSLFQPSSSALTPDSPFSDLVAYWLEDLELEDRLLKRTLQLYERNMQALVMPAFGNLTLREIGVAHCDHFLNQLAKQSYNRAKQARVVLRLALGLAVRHEVLPRNPMDHVSRLHRPAATPNAGSRGSERGRRPCPQSSLTERVRQTRDAPFTGGICLERSDVMCGARSASTLTVRYSRPSSVWTRTLRYPMGARFGVPPWRTFWRIPFITSCRRFRE